jgi:integrase
MVLETDFPAGAQAQAQAAAVLAASPCPARRLNRRMPHSQAGRRRFESGRPLSTELLSRTHLKAYLSASGSAAKTFPSAEVFRRRIGSMSKRSPIPRYRLHKQSGQAVVTLRDWLGRRRDVLLGVYDSPESRAEYRRVMIEWEANGRRLPAPVEAPADLTIAEMLVRYWRWAEQHYRDEHGQPSRELENLVVALKPLRECYGHTPAGSFGPLSLRALQERLAKSGLCRRVVNYRINRIRRAFKWAVSFELIPASIHEALCTVPGLQRGRGEAREAPPVQPAPPEHVNATLPHLPAPVRAMAELQLFTAMRPGEAMAMRALDLNTSGPVWTFRPRSHKNKHRGLERVLLLGPRAQEIIKPFLTTNLEAYLFSPRAYVEAMHRRRAEQRKTKRPPSQLKRKANPKRTPAECYNRRSYRVAIVRACQKAKLPEWSPLQLRHTAATAIRAKFGVEAAKVILGHTKVETAQIYAERDLGRAQEIMAEIG